MMAVDLDKLHPTGRNLGRVFNCRCGCVVVTHLCCYEAKLVNLKLKTQPKQLLGYLPLNIELHTASMLPLAP